MINTNLDQLLVVCLTAAVCLGLMLWLYFSNGTQETVLVSPFNGGTVPVQQGLYKVQVKEWVHATFTYVDVYTGTAQECKVQYNILRKRGYSLTDVRVVQVV
jgi:hypothetical protein